MRSRICVLRKEELVKQIDKEKEGESKEEEEEEEEKQRQEKKDYDEKEEENGELGLLFSCCLCTFKQIQQIHTNICPF